LSFNFQIIISRMWCWLNSFICRHP